MTKTHTDININMERTIRSRFPPARYGYASGGSTSICDPLWWDSKAGVSSEVKENAESEREGKIMIYGAASYVGKIVAEYIVDNETKKTVAQSASSDTKRYTYVLAGRTRSKLEKLVETMTERYEVRGGNRSGEKSLFNRLEVVDFPLQLGKQTAKGQQAKKDAEDEEEAQAEAEEQAHDALRARIRAQVSRVSVVVNLAGPYSTQGAEEIVRACAETGVGYVDLTGENWWVRLMIDRYDFLAFRTGAKIVCSCGFDSIPGDYTAYLAAKALSANSGTVDAEIISSQSFYQVKGGFSGGTVGSFYAAAEADKQALERGSGEFALARPVKGRPSPGPQLAYHNEDIGFWGTFFFMSPHNSLIVRRTWALLQQASSPFASSKTTETTTKTPVSVGRRVTAGLRYGQDFTYSEAFVIGRRGSSGTKISSFFAGLVMVMGFGLFMASGWLRKLVKIWAPKAGEGPAYESLQPGWMETTNVSKSSDGRVAVSEMFGAGDPGYYLTARMILECAFIISESSSSSSPPLFLPEPGQTGGILTPVIACGDELPRRLSTIERDDGTREFEFWSGSLEDWKVRRAERLQQRERQYESKKMR